MAEQSQNSLWLHPQLFATSTKLFLPFSNVDKLSQLGLMSIYGYNFSELPDKENRKKVQTLLAYFQIR